MSDEKHSRPNSTSEVRRKLEEFCRRLQDVLGDTLVSAVLYGPLAKDVGDEGGNPPVNVMLVLSGVTTGLLDRTASLVRKAARDFRLSVMVLSRQELVRSTDVFPVKFLDMRESHVVLCGESVLDDLLIEDSNLRLRCEQEARNVLLRLRALYLHREHDRKLLQATLSAAVSSLLTTLNAFLFLSAGSFRHSETEIAAAATKALRLDSDVLQRLLDLKEQRAKPDAQELKKLFGQLIAVAQRAADIIDRFGPAEG